MFHLLGYGLDGLIQGVQADRRTEQLIRQAVVVMALQQPHHGFQGFEQVAAIWQAGVRVQEHQRGLDVALIQSDDLLEQVLAELQVFLRRPAGVAGQIRQLGADGLHPQHVLAQQADQLADPFVQVVPQFGVIRINLAEAADFQAVAYVPQGHQVAPQASVGQFLIERGVAGPHQVDQGILEHQPALALCLDNVDDQATAEQVVGVHGQAHPFPVRLAQITGVVHHLGHQVAFADVPGFVSVHALDHPEQDLRVFEQQPRGVQGAEAFTHPQAPAGCSGSGPPSGSGARRR